MNLILERHLSEIRESILMMASLADRNFRSALRALDMRDIELTRSVEADDSEIDLLEIAVDEMVISCIATQHPVARDCRFMIVASKMAGSLERIGDQATTIARRVRGICAEPPLPPMDGFAEMAAIAQGMLNDSISALVQERWDSAQEIITRDSKVDEFHRKVAAELSDLMAKCPSVGTRVVHSLAITKAIERVADHAKHISELVYFLYCGKDIRHALATQGWCTSSKGLRQDILC
jgi:phosphate transport system protein